MTVRAELKEFQSPDLADLEGSQPEDPTNFGLLIQAQIGPAGDDAADTFSLVVCTPSWLAAELRQRPHIWGIHLLAVPKYDYQVIHAALLELCGNVEAGDWDDVADYLARYAMWEFEDFEDDLEE